MDVKSKANFINSIAGGQKISCPSCNALNDSDALFCFSCGTKLVLQVEKTVVNEENVQNSTRKVEQLGNVVDELAATAETTNNVTSKPAFTPVKRPTSAIKTVENAGVPESEKEQVFKIVKPSVIVEEESVSVFAHGLPSWDIIPPQIMVRRKKKK
jgi:hypothetical protein